VPEHLYGLAQKKERWSKGHKEQVFDHVECQQFVVVYGERGTPSRPNQQLADEEAGGLPSRNRGGRF
jgi:hypothetical protein